MDRATKLALFMAAAVIAVSYAMPSAPAMHALSRSAGGLIPHVDPTSIDILPGGAGAYPRITALANATLLASLTDRDTADPNTRILRVTRSTDGGRTFAALGEIARGAGDLDNPFLLPLASGDVVAAFRNHDLDAAGQPTFYRITTSVSHDGGMTWAFLSQVVERAATATKNGVWEPFLRLSKEDGSLQVYYASENSDADQDILLQTSRDNGVSWSKPVTVAGGTTTGRDGMPGCANFNDGAQKLMCVFETTEGRGTFSVKSVVSPDEGVNWGTRSQVYAPADSSKNAGAPQLVQTTDGNLVVSFMTDEDTTAPHTWPNSGVAFKIVTGPPVATGSWGHKTQVTAPQSSWPGLFAQDDDSVFACVGHADEGAICHIVTFTAS